MCFSGFDLLVGIPITVFYLYLQAKILYPFPGLRQEHYQFSQILQLPAAVWRSSTLSELNFELNRWIMVWVAFVFFGIFGFTEESRNNYQAILQSVVRVFTMITGIKSRPSSTKAEECVYFFFPFPSFSVLLYIFRLKFKAATRELDSINSSMNSSMNSSIV